MLRRDPEHLTAETHWSNCNDMALSACLHFMKLYFKERVRAGSACGQKVIGDVTTRGVHDASAQCTLHHNADSPHDALRAIVLWRHDVITRSTGGLVRGPALHARGSEERNPCPPLQEGHHAVCHVPCAGCGDRRRHGSCSLHSQLLVRWLLTQQGRSPAYCTSARLSLPFLLDRVHILDCNFQPYSGNWQGLRWVPADASAAGSHELAALL